MVTDQRGRRTFASSAGGTAVLSLSRAGVAPPLPLFGVSLGLRHSDIHEFLGFGLFVPKARHQRSSIRALHQR